MLKLVLKIVPGASPRPTSHCTAHITILPIILPGETLPLVFNSIVRYFTYFYKPETELSTLLSCHNFTSLLWDNWGHFNGRYMLRPKTCSTHWTELYISASSEVWPACARMDWISCFCNQCWQATWTESSILLPLSNQTFMCASVFLLTKFAYSYIQTYVHT